MLSQILYSLKEMNYDATCNCVVNKKILRKCYVTIFFHYQTGLRLYNLFCNRNLSTSLKQEKQIYSSLILNKNQKFTLKKQGAVRPSCSYSTVVLFHSKHLPEAMHHSLVLPTSPSLLFTFYTFYPKLKYVIFSIAHCCSFTLPICRDNDNNAKIFVLIS